MGDGPKQARRMASVLEIQDLHVSYRSREGVMCPALNGVSFALMPGAILGVLGESGSGKSTLAVSLVRLLPGNGEITRGAVHFEGKELLQAKRKELQQIRGRRISLSFQEPSLALHPTMRAGEQVRRVLIAQAIVCGPSVVIADEPTASLDPAIQMEILGVFRTLREKLGLAMIFITHNPALLSGFADRVLVLYGGQVVECGPAETVLASPRHPYTKALFQSIPAVSEGRGIGRNTRVPVLSGDSSQASWPRGGCQFEPRCTERMNICREREPALANLSASHVVSCFKYES